MQEVRLNQSVWKSESQTLKSGLTTTLKADVVVIGAGITGLTTAYLLKQAGKKVVVLEAHTVGSGTTGDSSAHLTSLWDGGYKQLIERHGQGVARDVFNRMNSSIEFIERISVGERISCDFKRVCGYYYAPMNSDDQCFVQTREALETLDIPFEVADSIPLPFDIKRALKIPDQARFHPGKYLKGLSALVEGDGSVVFENSRVVGVSGGSPCQVNTAYGKVTADFIVMATHTPLGMDPLHTEVAPYRSYLMLSELQNEPTEEMDGLFWDTLTPYHYTRLVFYQGKRLILVGGCDHKTAHDSETDSFVHLERYVRDHYPISRIVKKWSAQFYPPVDQLPFIGNSVVGSNVYVATGFSGDGLTFGTAAADIIAKKICDSEDEAEKEYADYYAPSRLKSVITTKFWKENLDVARHMIQDRITRSPVTSLEQLKPGEGGTVSAGLSPVAAYCSPNGSLEKFSAVCPHMGGIVRWNQEEESFDCPCHGARFDTEGKVIEGPALSGLKKL